MRYLLLISFMFLLLACAQPPQKSSAPATQPIANENSPIVLQKHNEFRARLFSDAPLSYSLELEQDAQTYANYLAKTGKFDHDPNNLKHKYGENLYAFSKNALPDYNDIVQKWYDEGKYYDLNSNHCQAGKLCGHYTQIVWKSTKLLGCASAQYKKGRFKNGYVTVCKYYPYGNIVGQRPY